MDEEASVSGSGGGGGKGGGGGSHRVAVEDPDSLRSRQYARVLDAISEGEIVGLVDPAGVKLGPLQLGKGIYLDDTPIMNPDGTLNFSGVVLYSNVGTPSQPYLYGYSDVEVEVTDAANLPVEVKKGSPGPIIRSISNLNIDRIRVTLAFPQLTSQDLANGDLHGAFVMLTVDVRVYTLVGGLPTPGAWETRVYDSVSGKTTTEYRRSYDVFLQKPPGYQSWDVRVSRYTDDSTSAALANKMKWNSYTEIIDAKLGYPNTALVGISIDAQQFRTIPRRAFDVKLLKVRVPANYNPVTRVYTGSWDGASWSTLWTDNPAWCFYDLITNPRYGLGQYISTAQVDKWALYSIAQYCDELVPNGLTGAGAGMEPRFTCNLYLQTQEEAYKVINDMASIFRAMVYWANGTIYASQDRPADPVALFSAANVIDGMFHYEGSSRRTRHTVALVSWNDPSDRYRQKIEYVEDSEGLNRYGVVQTQVVAVGCTSRGQAHRMGKWILYSDRMETEMVTFEIGLFDLSKVGPGAVIKVADSPRSGKRWGGRIVSATATEVTIDAPVNDAVNSITLVMGKTYSLSVVLPDGTVQARTVLTAGGSNVTILPVSVAYTQTPMAQAMWVLEEASLVAQTFRVLSIAEGGKASAKISAVEHNPSKYAAVEQGIVLQPMMISSLTPEIQAAVTNIVFSESLYKSKNTVKSRLTLGWSAPAGAVRYSVESRQDGGNWIKLPDTVAQSVDIEDTVPGTYDVRITAINVIGRASLPVTAATFVLGKTARPESVTGYVVARYRKDLNFSWKHVSDIDLDYYELRYGTDWNTAVPFPRTITNSMTVTSHQIGTFLIKAFDTTGNESLTATAIVVPELTGINVVVAQEEGNRSALNFTDTGMLNDKWASHGVAGFLPAAKTIEMWYTPEWTPIGGVYNGITAGLWDNSSDTVLTSGTTANGVTLRVVESVYSGGAWQFPTLRLRVRSSSNIAYDAVVSLNPVFCSAGVDMFIQAIYSATDIQIYINGELQSGATVVPVDVPTANFSTSGNIGWCNGANYSAAGRIDDVRIYNRALTSTEALEHFHSIYKSETGLVGYWPMNEGAGNQALDYSGKGNHAVIVGATYVTPGKDASWLGTRKGMMHDGVGLRPYPPILKGTVVPSLYASCAPYASYLIHPLTGFSPAAKTVEMIFTPAWSSGATPGVTYRVLWCNGDTGDVESIANGVEAYIYDIFGAANQQLILSMKGATGNLINYVTATIPSSVFVEGTSRHIVLTYSSTERVIYIDGVQVGYTNVAFVAPDTNNPTGKGLFGRFSNQLYPAMGVFENARIYNRAITATEALEHYNGVFTNESGLVGKWLFDEGTGTTSADSSGTGNTMALMDGAYWGTSSVGVYETLVTDLGAVIPSAIEIQPAIDQMKLTDSWATYTQPWSTYTQPWQGIAPHITATFEIRTALIDGAWSLWFPFVPGRYNARYFQFKVTLTTDDPAWTGRLAGFKIVADVDDRIVHREDVIIASVGTTVSVSPAFVNVQTIQVTMQSGAVGDKYVLSAKTNSSITVKLYDNANNLKAGVVDIDFFGYGEKT